MQDFIRLAEIICHFLSSWKYDHDDYLLLYGNIVVRVPEYQRREKLVDNIEKDIYHIKHIGKESI